MGKRVLVVDDERDILELTRLSLGLFGDWQVYQANNGPTALEKAKSLKPDVILLDYMMPEMSGGEVIKALKADPELQSIPVIVYTADPEAPRRDGVPDDVHILGKTLNPETLGNELQRACEANAK